MESISGRDGSASAVLASIALWRRRSSSAAALYPSMLFIITYIMTSRSRLRASAAYLCTRLWIQWIASLVSSLAPASSAPPLCLLAPYSFLLFSLSESSSSTILALKSKFLFLKLVSYSLILTILLSFSSLSFFTVTSSVSNRTISSSNNILSWVGLISSSSSSSCRKSGTYYFLFEKMAFYVSSVKAAVLC